MRHRDMKKKQEPNLKFIGHGIYTLAQASRLLRRQPARVRRWANGYSFPRVEGTGTSRPILQTPRDETSILDFRELVELFFVREYSSAGVPIQHIRQTAEALSKDYGQHPFASKKLLTDGRILFAGTEEGLIAPAVGQLIADFAEQFIKEVDFADDFVSIWWPREGEHKVAVDPQRRRGQPILNNAGVETWLIYERFKKEQELAPIAYWFEIAENDVKDAVEFEMRFADAA